jgi:tetratricopeptide (TPR) repeat protein
VAWKSHARNKDWFLSQNEERLRLSDLMQRAALLERAIGVDPSFARAYAELSWIYHLAAEYDPAMLANSRRAAAEAMRLDPHFPPARYVQGYIRFFDDWKFAEACRLWLEACRSNPLYESWYRQRQGVSSAQSLRRARNWLAAARCCPDFRLSPLRRLTWNSTQAIRATA